MLTGSRMFDSIYVFVYGLIGTHASFMTLMHNASHVLGMQHKKSCQLKQMVDAPSSIHLLKEEEENT